MIKSTKFREQFQ